MKIIEIAAIVISPIYVHLILNNCSSMLESKKKFIQREGYKSERRMPRLLEAMKDVVSCDKRRGTANRF